MDRLASYDFCIIGSGVIVNRLLSELNINQRRTLIVSDQMSLQLDDLVESRNIVIQTRKDFIESKNGITIHTLILSVKTNLWSDENDLDLLLHKANERGVSKVVLFSSGSVYGESTDLSKEDSDLQPVNSYGKHKLLEEIKTINIFRGKAQILVLRIANVYGDSMFDDIANRCIKSIKDSSPLLVYSGGTLTRDFLYIDDLAKILSQLIQSEFTLGLEYLNVSSGKGISISELIEQISQILSKKIKQLDVSRPSDVVKKSVLDNSKLREKVSCRYHTLEEGLTKYISS